MNRMYHIGNLARSSIIFGLLPFFPSLNCGQIALSCLDGDFLLVDHFLCLVGYAGAFISGGAQ